MKGTTMKTLLLRTLNNITTGTLAGTLLAVGMDASSADRL